MKLIKQVHLEYRGGSSDKVYEVDLCESGDGQYVVNFRYGRRGGTLKDGSKTPLPVARDKAEKLFDSLVAGKLKKGYYDTAGPSAGAVSPDPTPGADAAPPAPVSDDPVEQAILTRLYWGEDGPPTEQKTLFDAMNDLLFPGLGKSAKPARPWPLDRVIWRAGELRLHRAEPLLIRLLSSHDHQRNYCLAFALGRCGGPDSILHLLRLYDTRGIPDMVRRMAMASLTVLTPAHDAESLRTRLHNALPRALAPALEQHSSQSLSRTLDDFPVTDRPADYAATLVDLYLLGGEVIRPVILDRLCKLPLRPPHFKPLRHIFKLAEARDDPEVFGLLAYRFETTPPNYRASPYGSSVPIGDDRRWMDDDQIRRELASPKSRLAFSDRTRDYLRRRIWRHLQRLGEAGSPAYVRFAVALLRPFSDEDARPPKVEWTYHWDDRRLYRYRIDHDAYWPYWGFNHILYGNSPRYRPARSTWQCRDGYQPGDPAPGVREERFPHLWSRQPDAVLELLPDSRCRPVHEFAVKVLRDCPAFLETLDAAALTTLLACPYEVSAALGLELAEQRYDPQQWNRELVTAALNAAFPPARQRGRQWAEQQQEACLADSDFLFQVLTSPYPDTRDFGRTLLRNAYLAATMTRLLAGRLLAYLQGLEAEQEPQAVAVAEILLGHFGPELRHLGFGVIGDLLDRPLPAVQALAADILLNHHAGGGIPRALLHRLLESDFDTVRVRGLRLLDGLSDGQLRDYRDLIGVLALQPYGDLRAGARHLTVRLTTADPQAGPALLAHWARALLGSGLTAETADDLMRLIRHDLRDHWSHLDRDTVWRLLRARRPQAQELGGLLLPGLPADDLTVPQIIALADHEILTVRQAARELCRRRLMDLKADMAYSVKLLDARWDDTRAFAMDLFDTHFGPDELSPEVLVGICDSVREDVQQFGRRFITRHFQETQGTEYLLKLSEHPSAAMQLFATQFLTTYASGRPDRLAQLEPFFLDVLSRVNRGRVAKQRVLAFLEQEALQNPQAAERVARLLSRQSATEAITDKATMIRIMVRIRQKHGQLDLPIRHRTVESRC